MPWAGGGRPSLYPGANQRRTPCYLSWHSADGAAMYGAVAVQLCKCGTGGKCRDGKCEKCGKQQAMKPFGAPLFGNAAKPAAAPKGGSCRDGKCERR